MPHLTFTLPVDKALLPSMWKGLRQAMRQRLNCVVITPNKRKATQYQRNIRRFAVREGIPCLVNQRDENVIVTFL